MHTDIQHAAWMSKFPEPWHPYIYLMRLDRPIGVWLLLLPSLWGIALASAAYTGPTFKAVWLCFIFAVGAVIMRGAGCVINDLWDKDLDAGVERTRTRPLAAGDITKLQAFSFLGALLFAGFAILLTMNGTTIILGLLVVPLIIAYPLMKRFTYWPQVFLGFTFNFGALMGWAAMTDMVTWPAVLFYLAAIFWTTGYDTVYAHQDKEDDVLIGVKSTALKFGDSSKIWVGGFYGAAWALMALAIALASFNYIMIAGLLAVALHFLWQLKSWDMDDPQSALMVFKSNRDVGFLVLATIILSGF